MKQDVMGVAVHHLDHTQVICTLKDRTVKVILSKLCVVLSERQTFNFFCTEITFWWSYTSFGERVLLIMNHRLVIYRRLSDETGGRNSAHDSDSSGITLGVFNC